ncbi:helix-turn-helix domain-containing protein [Filifactor villosus]|uniref:Helix-turn-helix domain-containing protein n=1 Tax=Filifactor villosus TaxID=29374 RepID=A0ABV9QKS9_9FIRM
MEYSEFVKNVRKQLNYTQKELADALDVSCATVNRWENNQVLPSKLAVNRFLDFCENNFIDTTEFND